MLWGRNYMFAKLSSHIFFPGFLVITFPYLKGPICQCSLILISVSFTASGTLTPCSSRNNILPVMRMTHSTWKVCWLDFLNCYIRFPTIHEKINKKNLVSFWLSLVIHMQLLPPQRNCLKIMLRGWSVFMSVVVMGPGGMTFSFIFLFSYLFWISLHFFSKYLSEASIFPNLQIWL